MMTIQQKKNYTELLNKLYDYTQLSKNIRIKLYFSKKNIEKNGH